MLRKKTIKKLLPTLKGKPAKKVKVKHVPKKKENDKKKQNLDSETSTSTNLRLPRLHRFLDYEQIRSFLNALHQTYSDHLEMEIIGSSKDVQKILVFSESLLEPLELVLLPDQALGRPVPGRPIFLMLIAKHVELPRKNAIFIEAGSNGEDVVSVASALYIINYLCAHATNSTTLQLMDVFVLPCSNPDDYELTLYGKKNSLNLARSFPFRLAHYNADDIGIESYLEINHKWKENLKIQNFEKLAMIKGIADYQLNIKLFISLQEEGEKILYPFGTRLEPYDSHALSYVAKIGRLGSEIEFQVGSIFQQCGLLCGTIVDFLRLFSNYLKFTYIIHMNDKKKGQFFKKVPYLAENVLCVVTLMAREVDNYYKTQVFYPEYAKNSSLLKR